MRVKETSVYQFDELSDKAKERAREWYRDASQGDEWWDCTYDSIQDAAKYLGIEIDTTTNKHIGGYTKDGTWNPNQETQHTEPCIYFSGFSSQGDGACFYGTWKAEHMKTLEELKADFGDDSKLYALHSALWAYKEQYPSSWCTSTRYSSHYSHERSTTLEAVLDEEIDYNEKDCKPLEECLVRFMQWMYRQLEAEYDYRNSDEQIDESITANEYEFTEDGKRF